MIPFSNPSELEQGHQAQSEAAGLVGEQVLQADEEAIVMALAMLPNPMEVIEFLLDELVRKRNEADHESNDQRRENPCLYDMDILQIDLRREALTLVPYLIYKYWTSQLVTEVDIVNHIMRAHWQYFPIILDKASICLQLLFGIEMKEVDPIIHTYALTTAAGITYDGIRSHVQGMPKTGLLIIILCIVFTEGGCATEEAIWQVLSEIEVYPDKEHFIYGNPRRLLMEDFVGEQYLEYQQVPGSDPIIYQFMWGSRAYEETTKMRVLKHWASFSKIDPRAFGSLYEEALQEEQRAPAVEE
ncbi:melanoma-associated antigen 11-like [Thomomys bottae]